MPLLSDAVLQAEEVYRKLGQTEVLRPGEQVFDRRGVPPRSPPWRAFAHGLELSGNLLECVVGCCPFDPGDQPDKPVIALLRRGPVQQTDLKDAFIGQPSYGAAQPLDGPGRGLSAV